MVLLILSNVQTIIGNQFINPIESITKTKSKTVLDMKNKAVYLITK